MHLLATGALLVVAVFGCSAPAEDRAQPDTTGLPTTEPLPVLDSGVPALLPRDEADASFRSFRTAALEALSRQDSAFLYSILAPDIKSSFGGDDGIAGFQRIWRIDEGNAAVWAALARVLRLGGALQGDSVFIAPYIYAFWPDSIDAFEYVAAVTPNAAVRADATQASPPIGQLSHSIVKIDEWKNLDESGVPTDSTWARVGLAGGRSGWVRGLDVYSPVGWRAFFVRRNDQWVLQLFVAGD